MKAIIAVFAAILAFATGAAANEPIEFPPYSEPEVLRICKRMHDEEPLKPNYKRIPFMEFMTRCMDFQSMAYEAAKKEFEPIIATGHWTAQESIDFCNDTDDTRWLDFYDCSEGETMYFRGSIIQIVHQKTGQPYAQLEECPEDTGTLEEFITCIDQKSAEFLALE